MKWRNRLNIPLCVLGAWDKGTVEVCDGAAIDFTGADTAGTSWMKLKVAGSGPDGKGALILRVTRPNRYNACLRNMTLTADTLISLDGRLDDATSVLTDEDVRTLYDFRRDDLRRAAEEDAAREREYGPATEDYMPVI